MLLKIAKTNKIEKLDDFTNFYFDVEDDHKRCKLDTITAFKDLRQSTYKQSVYEDSVKKHRSA